MPPRPRGQYQIRRQRPRKRTSADSITYEIPLVGPYATLAAQEPAIGSAFSGYPASFVVIGTSLEDTGGGTGRMVVTIEASTPGQPISSDTTGLADPVYESDYSEERRPIEEHKRCGKLKATRPYYEYPDRATSEKNKSKTATAAAADTKTVYKQRTWEHWSALDSDDYEQSGASGSWSLEEYKGLREGGREDYPVAFPICSSTTYHRFRPASGIGINAVATPPSACSPPAGYIYVKTTDRVTKQGRVFTRVQAWRGYDNTKDLFFL